MPKQAINMSVESAQIWAINIAVNGNAHDEIETDHFRSILTTQRPNMGNKYSSKY